MHSTVFQTHRHNLSLIHKNQDGLIGIKPKEKEIYCFLVFWLRSRVEKEIYVHIKTCIQMFIQHYS